MEKRIKTTHRKRLTLPIIWRDYRQICRVSARYLDICAKALFEGHTVRGKWVLKDADDHQVKSEYDEMRSLASHLRKIARKITS